METNPQNWPKSLHHQFKGGNTKENGHASIYCLICVPCVAQVVMKNHQSPSETRFRHSSNQSARVSEAGLNELKQEFVQTVWVIGLYLVISSFSVVHRALLYYVVLHSRVM